MEEGGQYQRLLLALVLFIGELGAFLLLGSLSVGIILAQVLLLLLLAFGPVALVAAAIPGRGHDFFRGWLQKLAGYVLRKAAYSLILAILLAVNGALASATAQLGWLMSFGLQSLFFWAVFLQRKTLADSLIGIATGPSAPGREGTLRVLGVYAGARMGGRALRPLRRAGRSTSGGAGRLFGGGGAAGSGGRRRAPLFGTSYSAPVGGGAPSLDAPGPGEASRGAAAPAAAPDRSRSASSRRAASAATERAAAAPEKEERRRSRRSKETGESETKSSKAAAEKAKAKPRSSAQREGKQPVARPPVRKGADVSLQEPQRSLAEELRAERERGEAARKETSGEEGRPDSTREPAPPRRRRRRGKGGSR